MIQNYSIHNFFPDFILNDKNGYAMAKAIEQAMKIMCVTVQEGIDRLKSIDRMPEWRLDELAWEYDCLYEYDADIEAKRRWISNAASLSAVHGTAMAIHNYLGGYFDSISVAEQNAENGTPFHFRVTTGGRINVDNLEWACAAVEKSKNVRSVFEGINFLDGVLTPVYAGCALRRKTETSIAAPGYDTSGIQWYTDESGNMLLDGQGLVLLTEESA